MSEKYDFSKFEDRQKFEQLPQEKKEAIIGAAQDEAIGIDVKAKELAGENEKPTVRHYQEASEQINSNKEQKEVVLTTKQKKAKREVREWLDHDYVSDENIDYAVKLIRDNNLPYEVVKEYIEEVIINLILYWDVTKGGSPEDAMEAKKRFALSNEHFDKIVEKSTYVLVECLDAINFDDLANR